MVLLAREHSQQPSLLDDDVLLDTPPVRRKLAGRGALRDDVPDELDPAPPEVRR
jgi:hypothetical protein